MGDTESAHERLYLGSGPGPKLDNNIAMSVWAEIILTAHPWALAWHRGRSYPVLTPRYAGPARRAAARTGRWLQRSRQHCSQTHTSPDTREGGREPRTRSRIPQSSRMGTPGFLREYPEHCVRVIINMRVWENTQWVQWCGVNLKGVHKFQGFWWTSPLWIMVDYWLSSVEGSPFKLQNKTKIQRTQ